MSPLLAVTTQRCLAKGKIMRLPTATARHCSNTSKRFYLQALCVLVMSAAAVPAPTIHFQVTRHTEQLADYQHLTHVMDFSSTHLLDLPLRPGSLPRPHGDRRIRCPCPSLPSPAGSNSLYSHVPVDAATLSCASVGPATLPSYM